MQAFKLGKTKHTLYYLDDELLLSKTFQEVAHYLASGKFPASREKMLTNPKIKIFKSLPRFWQF